MHRVIFRVANEIPNWSDLSNVASATTIPTEGPSGIACGSWSDGTLIDADWGVIPVTSGTSTIDFLATQETGDNPSGRLVRTLVNDTLPASMHASGSQADDTDGRRLPSGVYLYRLQAGERVATRTACVIE